MKKNLIAVLILAVVGAGLLYGAGMFLQYLSESPKQPATQTTPQNEALIPSNPTPTTNGTLQTSSFRFEPVFGSYILNNGTEYHGAFKTYEDAYNDMPSHIVSEGYSLWGSSVDGGEMKYYWSFNPKNVIEPATYKKAEPEPETVEKPMPDLTDKREMDVWSKAWLEGWIAHQETHERLRMLAREYIYETKVVTEIMAVKPFTSEQELETWLKAHIPPVVIIAGVDGIANFDNPQPNTKSDCDDYADLLVKWAARDGYYLSLCPVQDGYVWGEYVYSKPGCHIGVLANIGNAYYYIEPTQENKITKLKTGRD